MHKNTPQTNAGYGLAACAHYNPPQRPFMGFDAIARHFPNMRIRGKTARGPCPVHQSGNPKGQTLAMREKPEGSIEPRCFAGCDLFEILSAVGLTYRDLLPEHLRHNRQHVEPGRPFFDAHAAISAIVVDANVVRIVANHLIDGTASREDHDALRHAHHRISTTLAAVARHG